MTRQWMCVCGVWVDEKERSHTHRPINHHVKPAWDKTPNKANEEWTYERKPERPTRNILNGGG